MAVITITGGTGFIGSVLSKKLIEKGHEIIILTRKARPSPGPLRYKEWDVANGSIDATAITEADAIVHLAGASVADERWTEKRKQEIVDSRVKSGQLLVKALSTQANQVQTVVSASAIGWYGPDPVVPNPRPFVETDKAHSDFLGETCAKWEGAIAPVTDLGKRLVILRTGIVLGREGGAYAEFKKPLKFGVAAILGKGNQMVSWIHIDDLAGLYIAAIEDQNKNGIYNAVAPKPVSNKELILTMARQRGGFAIPLHVPAPALKIALGEMSVEVLKSTTVSSKKAEAAGYQFLFPTLERALADLEHKRP